MQAQFTILLSPAPTTTVKVYLLVRGNATAGGVDYDDIDDMMPAAPGWLTDWTVERDRLPTNDPHSGRRLYSKPFNSGPIALGGNRDAGGATGYQMYTVVIAPESGPANEAAAGALYE